MIDLLGGSIMVELSSWDFLFSHTGDVKGSEEGSNADTWAFHPWSCVSNTLAFERARHWLLEVWLIKLDNHLSTHFTEFSQFSKKLIFSSWRESIFVDSLIPFEYRSLENSTPGEVIWRGIPKEVVWLLTYFLLCSPILGRFYEGQKALSWPHCNSAFLPEEVSVSRNYSTALRDASLGPGLVALWEENGHNKRE